MSDTILRFIFDATDIRGEWVQLEHSYRDTLANHHYPPAVRNLIGEFLAGVSLLGATLKFAGSVILQARSDGEIPLIMAEATSQQELRAIVHGAEHATSDDFQSLLGAGTLTITIDPSGGQRYQGIVPLDGDCLAACLESYFRQSEQLPTRVWLAADGRRAGGLFLQELPSRVEPEQRAQQWQHLSALAATVRAEELLELPGETLLHRLFHQEQLRLLQADALQFRCSCSQSRTEGMLISLGRDELEQILAEQGIIKVNCEFCNQLYQFDAAAIAALFTGDGAALKH
jgi:molecular chaperone Hsp33